MSVTGKDVSLRDATALVLGASAISGNALLTVGGALTQSAAVTVAGTTNIAASGQDVVLSNAGNDFTGAVSVAGKDGMPPLFL